MQYDCVLHHLSLITLAILGVSFQSFMSIISERIGRKAKNTLSIYPYFCVAFSSLLHVSFSLSLAKTAQYQVVFGQPDFLLPGGVQLSAILEI